MGIFSKNDKKEIDELMPAKCIVTGRDFDITLKRRNGRLMMVEGKKRRRTYGKNAIMINTSEEKEGMKTLAIDGGIFTEKTYHCPICGNKDIVRCGKCHSITCYDGSGTFKCAHCGNSGKVSGTIQQIHVHSSDDKKSSRNGDKPYYPGDKPFYPRDK